MKFSIEEVHSAVLSTSMRVTLGSEVFKVSSVRLRTFATKGVVCICCGCEGGYYQADPNSNGVGYHLNLYTASGILMTRDHIIPHSMKGPDTVENMNPMCFRCNTLRGTEDLDEFLSRHEKGKFNNRTVLSNGVKSSIDIDFEGAVTRHVEKYGLESYLKDILRGQRKSGDVKTSLLRTAEELDDADGIIIVNKFIGVSGKLRRKLGSYFRNKYNVKRGQPERYKK